MHFPALRAKEDVVSDISELLPGRWRSGRGGRRGRKPKQCSPSLHEGHGEKRLWELCVCWSCLTPAPSLFRDSACVHSSRLALVTLHIRFKAVCLAQGLMG